MHDVLETWRNKPQFISSKEHFSVQSRRQITSMWTLPMDVYLQLQVIWIYSGNMQAVWQIMSRETFYYWFLVNYTWLCFNGFPFQASVSQHEELNRFLIWSWMLTFNYALVNKTSKTAISIKGTVRMEGIFWYPLTFPFYYYFSKHPPCRA